MRRPLLAAVVSAAFMVMSSATLAHHSFAMFDKENLIDLEGIVQEFKYVSPHSFILLQVKDQEGATTVWNLEGGSPSALARDGWTSTALKPGDQIILKVAPLRSGAPGGSWTPDKIKFKDGRLIVVDH